MLLKRKLKTTDLLQETQNEQNMYTDWFADCQLTHAVLPIVIGICFHFEMKFPFFSLKYPCVLE